MNFKRNGSKQLKFVERMILIWSLSEPKSVQRNEKKYIQKIILFALNEAFCHKINLFIFFALSSLNSLFMHNFQADQITIAQIHSFFHPNMQFRFHLSSLIIIKL